MTLMVSSDTMDVADRATAILKTVWLAMMSDTFGPEDVGEVADTIYEALHRMEKVRNDLLAANEQAIEAVVQASRARPAHARAPAREGASHG